MVHDTSKHLFPQSFGVFDEQPSFIKEHMGYISTALLSLSYVIHHSQAIDF